MRGFINREAQPVIKDGVEIRHASKADFTDEAWEEIQSLPHNSNGETISNDASGRKIHKGFMTEYTNKGKEMFIPKTGRADAVIGNTIYCIVFRIRLHTYYSGNDAIKILSTIIFNWYSYTVLPIACNSCRVFEMRGSNQLFVCS